jgi:hypothetical protein
MMLCRRRNVIAISERCEADGTGFMGQNLSVKLADSADGSADRFPSPPSCPVRAPPDFPKRHAADRRRQAESPLALRVMRSCALAQTRRSSTLSFAIARQVGSCKR